MPGMRFSTIFRPMMSQARAPELTLTVNGEIRRVAPEMTLDRLLRTLDLDPRLVVVERNREILRDRAAFPRLRLEDGDTLEIVHFVGGG